MSGSIKPVGVEQTVDGRVIGRFHIAREGRDTLLVSIEIPQIATREEIGQLLLSRMQRISTQEPAASMSVLETMIAADAGWTV